ncbi:metallophosphoesterase [Kiritimatiellota bacterium B12222]|nr:metallophosphoesterase [Kiritimatiellota bacterium B12222]
MKMIHFGDLHVWNRTPMMWSELYYPKRWLGPLNLLLHRSKFFPPAYRQAAMDAILAEEPDVAVFTGDFSSFSLKSEFEQADELFAPLREKLGERLFAIPGNHDVYTTRVARRRVLENSLPWVHTDLVTRLDLNDRLSLLGVNHSCPFLIASNGKVTPEAQERLRAMFDVLNAEGRTVLLAGHYPYISPPEFPEANNHKLLGDDELAQVVKEGAPAVYMHGHHHIRWAVRPRITPETLCLNCGSVSMKHARPDKQAGFLSWDQQDDGEVRNLTAHTYDGKSAWAKSPVDVRVI